MDLLARREHSRRELCDKLKRRFHDPALVEAQVDRLADEGLQSDQRFAESFLRQRVSRGHGPLRVRQELRQRGVTDEQMEAAFAGEPCDWFDLAAQALQRKFGDSPCVDMRERARRARFMQYRGFAFEHFADLLE
ncbi:regulatory protein RecX [Mangrovimicrobium sediminis]|nr:regulatory protein RecX [Haliea sp. SAOS-164]